MLITAIFMPFCPSCGQQLAEGVAFCSSCGKPVPQSQTPNNFPRPTKYCQACGATIDREAEVCPRCGVRVAGGVAQRVYEDVTGKAVYNTTYGRQGLASKYCQKCGRANDPAAPYCVECGEVAFAATPPSRIPRPTGVTVIAVLQIVISILNIIIGLALAAVFSFLLPGLGVLVAVLSFLPLFFAFALFTGRNWARILNMIGAVLMLFAFPLGTVFGIGILYYLTRPRVVAYFKQPK